MKTHRKIFWSTGLCFLLVLAVSLAGCSGGEVFSPAGISPPVPPVPTTPVKPLPPEEDFDHQIQEMDETGANMS